MARIEDAEAAHETANLLHRWVNFTPEDFGGPEFQAWLDRYMTVLHPGGYFSACIERDRREAYEENLDRALKAARDVSLSREADGAEPWYSRYVAARVEVQKAADMLTKYRFSSL